MCAGENEAVRSATRRPRILGRGLRILAMDGGGMKVGPGLKSSGPPTVQNLRAAKLISHGAWQHVGAAQVRGSWQCGGSCKCSQAVGGTCGCFWVYSSLWCSLGSHAAYRLCSVRG